VADWTDVRRLALALPDTEEHESRGQAQWRVHDKIFVWERPLRSADLEALGDAAPQGPVLGARVADEGVKQALCAEPSGVYFTTPHFEDQPAVLVRLDDIGEEELAELVEDAWLCRAPVRLARDYLTERLPRLH